MKDIIIVEDTASERERLEKLFKSHGYSVVCCESVGDAEKTLEFSQFRLAILDIGLGDKSGSLLFDKIKRGSKAAYIIIFTGNPSVHLKQRFIGEGALDYVVKGSPQAQNEALIGRVREILGKPQNQHFEGLELSQFLNSYVDVTSRSLFYEVDQSFPACRQCGAREYVVSFSGQAQVPPLVNGLVICVACGKEMDPEVQ